MVDGLWWWRLMQVVNGEACFLLSNLLWLVPVGLATVHIDWRSCDVPRMPVACLRPLRQPAEGDSL
jgi:hypothetical protein